jgi:hypothetical protein
MYLIRGFVRSLLLVASFHVGIEPSKTEPNSAKPDMIVAPISDHDQIAQIAFLNPEGARITWDVVASGRFDSTPLTVPCRHDFPSGALYRLKLSNLPGRPNVELYPTLEIRPTESRSEGFLSRNAIPIDLHDEDFANITSGEPVTKVVYLPDPEFQELTIPGVYTLVSTRLDPGVDPIAAAEHRGVILAIVRIEPSAIPAAVTPSAERPRTIGSCHHARCHRSRFDRQRWCRDANERTVLQTNQEVCR